MFASLPVFFLAFFLLFKGLGQLRNVAEDALLRMGISRIRSCHHIRLHSRFMVHSRMISLLGRLDVAVLKSSAGRLPHAAREDRSERQFRCTANCWFARIKGPLCFLD